MGCKNLQQEAQRLKNLEIWLSGQKSRDLTIKFSHRVAKHTHTHMEFISDGESRTRSHSHTHTHVSKPILSLDLIPRSGLSLSLSLPLFCSFRFYFFCCFRFRLGNFAFGVWIRWQMLSSFAFSAKYLPPSLVWPTFAQLFFVYHPFVCCHFTILWLWYLPHLRVERFCFGWTLRSQCMLVISSRGFSLAKPWSSHVKLMYVLS